LTDEGRARFLEYIAELEKVVASAQQSTTETTASKRSRRNPPSLGRAVPNF
jgi:hypothetical protein